MNKAFKKLGKKISSEMVMILIIGILFGIAIKTEVSKKINIADKNFYAKQSYDFTQLQKEASQGESAQEEAQPNN